MVNYNEKAGMRVLAICKVEKNIKLVLLFGRGVMTGAQVPHGAAGALAKQVISENSPNPRIKLDNGEIIWGCECWWLPEQKGDLWLMELKDKGYQVKDVDIVELRRHFDALEGKDEQKEIDSIVDSISVAADKRHRHKQRS